MYIVTGGAGFIGANIVRALNGRGIDDILVVDDLSNGYQFNNLVNYNIRDYMDKKTFLSMIENRRLESSRIIAIIHQGACSSTIEWDGKYMMENNYHYSKRLLHFCLDERIPFLYASSAATYGHSTTFIEKREYEVPVNVYGYSKFQFDQYIRKVIPKAKSQIIGLKYFNVYGQHEKHKESMASFVYQCYKQFKSFKYLCLFNSYDGYKSGEQSRDFIYVKDVAKVNLWFLDHSWISGIFNCGTGQTESFNRVANIIIEHYGEGEIKYTEFPNHLKGYYQSYTKANLDKLRSAGCDMQFKSIDKGVKDYLIWLDKN
jgi:ADP-L-glycero-D-manno-heptose 6-epimerase